MISRELASRIINSTPPKAVVIFGPRRAGKTTLVKSLPNLGVVNFLNGDRRRDVRVLQSLESAGDVEVLLSGSDTIIIDEAQRIPDIGLIIKLLVDANKNTRIFLTGSSSLDLAKGVRESAVGRLVTRRLWPFSVSEVAGHVGWGQTMTDLERHMVFGLYPEVVTMPETAVDMLMDYAEDIMYKDVFELSGIRNPSSLRTLVEMLARRIGQEVSYESLARDTKLHSQTIERYIDLLEKCFIVRRCGSFSRNLDNELKKGKKIYFCDVGVRNAVIGDFSPFSARSDAGALWENFFFMERLKKHDLERTFTRQYFWRVRGARLKTGAVQEYSREIDFIEARGNELAAFECKLSPETKDNGGKEFRSAYPECPIRVVTPSDCRSLFETTSSVL